MALVEKFLGTQVTIPEDRRYALRQGLWALQSDRTIVFGMTQPALVLSGGVKDVDWLVEEGSSIAANEAVVFAITGKILYIDAPIPGKVQFNRVVKENPTRIRDDPYGEGWIFLIQPQKDIDTLYHSLASWEAYFESLRGTEGFKNPEGKKGGVSGICKSVYTGIGAQKI
jgi:glycine cleavage system H protein